MFFIQPAVDLERDAKIDGILVRDTNINFSGRMISKWWNSLRKMGY